MCYAPGVAGLALALLSPPLVAAGSWRQFEVDSVAWLSFVLGSALRWWGTFYLASSPRGMLVASGPYSMCRHPIQLGNLFLGASLALFVGSATFGVGAAFTAVAYVAVVVAAEEHRLMSRFGIEYAAYRRRVPAFWMRPGLYHSPETVFVDGVALAGELRRTALWMWLPVLGKTFAQLRAEAWLPHLLRLP